jgi:type I restriction enzyme, S subunit
MSKIDELIQKLCPLGVEMVSLGQVARVDKGKQINREELSDEFPYPVFNGGVGPSGRHIEANFPANTITVSQGGASAGYVNFVSEPLWVGAHCYALMPTEKVSNRFLYFWVKFQEPALQKSKYGAGIPALDKTTLMNLPVPLPPLEVQKEIVSILDKFTQLEAELEAELEARRKQLEYLSNSEIERASAEPGTRALALSEVSDVFDGVHATPAYTDSGIRFVSVEDIENLYDSRKFISEEDFSKYRKSPMIGDLLMTRIGSIGTCAVVYRDEPLAYYVSLALIKPKPGIVNSEYLKILLESPIGIAALRTKSLTHAVPIKINLGDLRSLVIPVPSVSSQDKLVRKILPAQQLVKNLTIGLPAEIAARLKQYEYYRNKLLTFKELDAA